MLFCLASYFGVVGTKVRSGPRVGKGKETVDMALKDSETNLDKTAETQSEKELNEISK